MIDIKKYVENIKVKFPQIDNFQPWEIIDNLEDLLLQIIKTLDHNYKIENNIVITTESEENDSAAISLMNWAAIKTFLNGGTVYLLDKEDMPNPHSRINALYRY